MVSVSIASVAQTQEDFVKRRLRAYSVLKKLVVAYSVREEEEENVQLMKNVKIFSASIQEPAEAQCNRA